MPVQGKGRNRQSSNAVAELNIDILTTKRKDKKIILEAFDRYKYQATSVKLTSLTSQLI